MGASREPRRLGPAFEGVLTAAQLGAGWAFARLFDLLGAPVAGYLRAQGVRDPDGVANECFLKAFDALDRFRGDETKFRSWVFTIAHNLVLDERRRTSRRVQESELIDLDALSSPPTVEGADDMAFDRLGTERVITLLADLAPGQRDVLLLRIVADLTAKETAAALGKSTGAVKQLQRRGLESLRRGLRAQTEGVPL